MTYVTSQPRETPAEPSPREMSVTTTSTNAARMKSHPLGELGGSSTSCCFCTANGGLFERPRAAFFTVVAAVVMPCMTVGMVETTRRKTRFPTVGTAVHAKAKPPSAATAFCIYFTTLAGAINSGKRGYGSPHFLSFSWGRVQWVSLHLHLIIYKGGGSMEKSQTRCAFSLNCVQLALTLNNLGCVSTIQVEKTRFFL